VRQFQSAIVLGKYKYVLLTSNFGKNTPLRVVFSALFSVFGFPDETLSLVFDILPQTY